MSSDVAQKDAMMDLFEFGARFRHAKITREL